MPPTGAGQPPEYSRGGDQRGAAYTGAPAQPQVQVSPEQIAQVSSGLSPTARPISLQGDFGFLQRTVRANTGRSGEEIRAGLPEDAGGIIDTTANIPQVANAAQATSALVDSSGIRQGVWREGDPNMPESLRGTPSAPPQDARVLREGRGLMVGGMDYDPSIGINAQRAAQGVSPDLQRIQEGTQAMRSLQDAQRLEARRRAGDHIPPAGQAPSP